MPKKITCGKCGGIHDYNFVCKGAKKAEEARKKDYNAYKRGYTQRNEHDREMKTARWVKKRASIIEGDGHVCQRCLYKYGIITTDPLEVHHIKPRVKYPHLIFVDENLITLCRSCNLQLGIQEELDFEFDFGKREKRLSELINI